MHREQADSFISCSMKLIFLQPLASGFSKELSKVGRIQGELLEELALPFYLACFPPLVGFHGLPFDS